ncbi:MAG: hypothetical protein JWM09_1006 [Francisellaceae bacterium]|nr:hypothetical protein [Francisellaceae bacterium]
MATINKIMLNIILMLIKGYRFFLSPIMCNHCRFYPSCSEYGLLAFKYYGLITGFKLTLTRIFRCRPGNAGGIDFLPHKEK